MKMIYGGVPVNSMKLKHYEISTNDCDMIASDLQAGKTAVAKGRKIVGTGKSFEFANYGEIETNQSFYIPSNINVVQISCTNYPIKSNVAILDTKNIDYATEQVIAVMMDELEEYPITVVVNGNILTIGCNISTNIQIFYGKDNYT